MMIRSRAARAAEDGQVLDADGVLYLWGKIKEYVAENGGGASEDVTAAISALETSVTQLQTGKADATTVASLDTEVTNLKSTAATKTEVQAVNNALANKANLSDIANVYKYKGTVASVSALPSTGNTNGDVWNTSDTGMDYAWVTDSGSTTGHWNALGTTVSITPISNATIDAIVNGTYTG